MNPSIQHLVKAVVASLEGEVLPHLDPQTAPASNVRACLMLLANIESRVVHEPTMLYEDNCELREVLQAAAGGADTLGIDDEMRTALDSTLQKYPSQDHFFDPQLAACQHNELQELLTRLINRLPVTHGDKSAFRAKLHRYLDASGKRELQLAEKALARVPV